MCIRDSQQYRYQIDVVNARVTVANAARETSMSTPGGRSRLTASFPPAVDEEELLDALRREATHVAQMIAQLAAPTHPGWDANVGVAGGAEGVYAYGGLRAPPGGQGGGGNGGDRTGGAVHPAVAAALEVADRQAKNKILHSIFGKRKRGSAASALWRLRLGLGLSASALPRAPPSAFGRLSLIHI